MAGCDDLLDVTPGSDMTDEGFWKSENDLKGACNRLYQQLSSGGHDTRADDQIAKSPSSISNGQRTIQDANESDWKDPYDRIFLANNIIEKASASSVTESVRDRYIGEALFFRAWYHFDLVCKYGDVPLVTKVFSSGEDPDLKMPRTSREEVIQQCYNDLEFAAAHLPTRAQWTTTDEFDRRRVTRSSALGLIVRIGLYEGTRQKYHNLYNGANYKAHLKRSIDAFEQLRQEGHELYTASDAEAAFRGVFFEENQNSNKEIIFGKAYGPNGGSGSGYTNHNYSGDNEGSYALTRKMIDLFLYADGLPAEKSPLRIANEASFNNVAGLDGDGNVLPGNAGARDPRLLMTIWTVNDALEYDETYGWMAPQVGKGNYKPFDSQRPFGYQLKKRFKGSLWGASKDYTDIVLIRWGEMLIDYAEALYEYNGTITDEQLNETVNALRARVGFDKKLTNAFAAANGLDMLNEIRRERTVELMAENLRYNDLMRWKTAETELPQAVLGAKYVPADASSTGTIEPARLTNASGVANGVKVMDGNAQENIYVVEFPSTRKFNPERDYYYPIPPYEIVHSDGNVTQNPGW